MSDPEGSSIKRIGPVCRSPVWLWTYAGGRVGMDLKEGAVL